MELKCIWETAYIPMKPERDCLDLLMSVHKLWTSAKKISRLTTDNSKEKISHFQSLMDTLCDFSPSNVETLLGSSRTTYWKEDLAFLIGQRKYPQIGRMEGVDGYEQLRQQRKESRSNRTRPTENLVHHSSSSSESEQDIPECGNSI